MNEDRGLSKAPKRKIVTEVYAAICAICRVKPDSTNVDNWQRALSPFNPDQIEHGYNKFIQVGKNGKNFMPSPGDFIELCLSNNAITIESEAKIAFGLVWNSLSHIISPYFKDPVIAETIRNMGGWGAITMWETKDRPWREKDFIDIYVTYKRQVGSNFDPMLKGYGNIRFIGNFSPEEKKMALIQIEKNEETQKLLAEGMNKLLIGEKPNQEEIKKAKKNIADHAEKIRAEEASIAGQMDNLKRLKEKVFSDIRKSFGIPNKDKKDLPVQSITTALSDTKFPIIEQPQSISAIGGLALRQKG